MKTELGYRTILRELTSLVHDTFLLWTEHWVGFSWRHYYFNHTQRVQALCQTLGVKEQANLKALDFAAILHDITKRYDGEIILDTNGQRVLDANGFWHNELLLPQQSNIVTTLYYQLNLFHTLHNYSGALIAKRLLETYGFDSEFCNLVCAIIESHLKPDLETEHDEHFLEKQILYEVDTLDSNIGLTAFYRNIQIRTHYTRKNTGQTNLSEYIQTIEPWIKRKRSFMEKIMTTTGVGLAEQRLERMNFFYDQILEEYHNHFDTSLHCGLLGVMQFFMDHNADPNLAKELSYLCSHWLPSRSKRVRQSYNKSEKQVYQIASYFCHLLQQEIIGQL